MSIILSALDCGEIRISQSYPIKPAIRSRYSPLSLRPIDETAKDVSEYISDVRTAPLEPLTGEHVQNAHLGYQPYQANPLACTL